jgi:hypothetical protein
MKLIMRTNNSQSKRAVSKAQWRAIKVNFYQVISYV